MIKSHAFRISLERLQKCHNSTISIATQIASQGDHEEFRVFKIWGKEAPYLQALQKFDLKKRSQRKVKFAAPRFTKMTTDQDWTNVWPTSTTFKWSVFPVPVRQGFIRNNENDRVIPGKYANAELMKIPNFLHLTPPHIKKHCKAIKKFCTPWPKELKTDEDCFKYFPLQVTTSDYCWSGPSVSEPKARKVTFKLRLHSLYLDSHSHDKIIRLAKHRYDPYTDILTISSDACPSRKQNYDYCQYLFAVLYNEAWKIENWETDMKLADMQYYDWNLNSSQESLLQTLHIINNINQNNYIIKSPDTGIGAEEKVENESEITKEEKQLKFDLSEEIKLKYLKYLPVQDFRAAVEDLKNRGETIGRWNRYKQSMLQIYRLEQSSIDSPDSNEGLITRKLDTSVLKALRIGREFIDKTHSDGEENEDDSKPPKSPFESTVRKFSTKEGRSSVLEDGSQLSMVGRYKYHKPVPHRDEPEALFRTPYAGLIPRKHQRNKETLTPATDILEGVVSVSDARKYTEISTSCSGMKRDKFRPLPPSRKAIYTHLDVK